MARRMTSTSPMLVLGMRLALPRERFGRSPVHRQDITGGVPETIARQQHGEVADCLRRYEACTHEVPLGVCVELLLHGQSTRGSALAHELPEQGSVHLVGVDGVDPDA